jgi:hypothetical protein
MLLLLLLLLLQLPLPPLLLVPPHRRGLFQERNHGDQIRR